MLSPFTSPAKSMLSSEVKSVMKLSPGLMVMLETHFCKVEIVLVQMVYVSGVISSGMSIVYRPSLLDVPCRLLKEYIVCVLCLRIAEKGNESLRSLIALSRIWIEVEVGV